MDRRAVLAFVLFFFFQQVYIRPTAPSWVPCHGVYMNGTLSTTIASGCFNNYKLESRGDSMSIRDNSFVA